MSSNRTRDIPEELQDLVKELVIYDNQDQEEEIEESGLEYLYYYDYSDYPEHNYEKSEPESTIIKIDL